MIGIISMPLSPSQPGQILVSVRLCINRNLQKLVGRDNINRSSCRQEIASPPQSQEIIFSQPVPTLMAERMGFVILKSHKDLKTKLNWYLAWKFLPGCISQRCILIALPFQNSWIHKHLQCSIELVSFQRCSGKSLTFHRESCELKSSGQHPGAWNYFGDYICRQAPVKITYFQRPICLGVDTMMSQLVWQSQEELVCKCWDREEG